MLSQFLPGLAGLNNKATLDDLDKILVGDSQSNMWNSKQIGFAQIRALMGGNITSVNGLTGIVSLGLLDLDGVADPVTSGHVLSWNGSSFVWVANGAGGGEVNTASNTGTGEDIFKEKTGVDLVFRGILGEDGVVSSTDGDNVVLKFDPSTLTAPQISDLAAAIGVGGGGGSAVWYQDSTSDGTITGAVNGSNVTFVLSHVPGSATSLVLSYNGQVLERGATDDYTIADDTITMVWAPVSGKLTAIYPSISIATSNAATRESSDNDALAGEVYRSTDDSNSLYYKGDAGDLVKLVDETTHLIPEASVDLATTGTGDIVRESAIPEIPTPPNIDETYPAGDTMSAGNAVFIENAPTVVGSSMSTINIGDTSLRTRITIPIFGTGVASNILPLPVTKTSSPAGNLNVRIEEDDGSGNPNGTLVDVNATGSIDLSSLTSVAATDAHGQAISLSSSTSAKMGINFTATKDIYITKAKINNWSGTNLPTKGYILLAGVVQITGELIGDTIYFPKPFRCANGGTYTIAVDNNGSSYTYNYKNSGVAYPYAGTNMNIVSAWDGSANTTTQIFNIINISSESLFPVDTNCTLAGSITIPNGKKCHVVLFQGTYGAETIDSTNFYRLGVRYDIHTTTRQPRFYNGTSWTVSTSGDIYNTVINSANRTTNTSITTSYGVRIYANNNCNLFSVVPFYSYFSGATRIRLFSDAGAVLKTVVCTSSAIAIIDYNLTAGTYYRLEYDNSGASWNSAVGNPASFPYNGTNINIVSESYGGTSNATQYSRDIWKINTFASPSQDSFSVATGSLVSPRVLCKTDADYSYKIDWHGITQEAVTAAELQTTGKSPKVAISGIDSNQTGMTQGATQYLGNTPGAISSSAGTILKRIGDAISATQLEIKKYLPKNVALNFTRDCTAASNTVTYTHNLGKIPSSIQIYAKANSISSIGFYTDSGTNTVYERYSSISGNDTTNIIYLLAAVTPTGVSGVISNITETTFDIVWTQIGSVSITAYFTAVVS